LTDTAALCDFWSNRAECIYLLNYNGTKCSLNYALLLLVNIVVSCTLRRNKEANKCEMNSEDTVSADEKDDEVEADNGTERGHSAVSLDAIVHHKVPVFACQYLHRQPAS